MNYKTLGFTLFRKCSANCDVCCFESSPKCTERLDIEQIKKYINSAVGDKDLKNISLTGGEPFLEYQVLIELVQYATEKGFKASLITNCFWADSEEKAVNKLQALKNVGLKQMNVSFDQFHNEYISADRVANVLNACRKISIPVVIGMIKKSGTDVGNLVNQLGDSVLNTGLMIYPVLPVGGAKKNLKESDFIKYPLEELSMKCQYDGNLVVRYDGKIQPCCNQCIVGTELIVGDYLEDDYQQTLYNIKNNGILFLLRTIGLREFIQYAKDVLKMKLPKEAVSSCEICELLFCKENLDKFYPFVKERIEKIQMQSGIEV